MRVRTSVRTSIRVVLLGAVCAGVCVGTAVGVLRAADTEGGQKSISPAAADLDPSVRPMRGVIDRYSEDLSSLQRSQPVSTSDARFERLRKYYEAELRELRGVEFDKLDQAGRVDYVLLRNEIETQLRQLEHERKKLEEVASLVPFAKTIVGLEESRRKLEAFDPQDVAKTVTEIATQVGEARKGLEQKGKGTTQTTTSKGDVTPVVANRAARTVDSLRNTLRRWHEFYAGYDPAFTWWMKEPYGKADKALADYSSFLRKKLAGFGETPDEEPLIGDPIGREALLDALKGEMIPYTPEQLIEIANREFAWCEKEMRRAAKDLGIEDEELTVAWPKALDRVSRKYVPPGGQPKLIAELAEEAVKFLEDRDLVTIPELCKQTWRMEMMTPERQRVNPYFTGGEVISVSYPTDTMSHEDKLMSMRGNNPAFSRATVQHELIPGHHLQIFMSERYNTHRRLFRTPFLVEGWALYWEMLLWDLDFPRNAEDRVGMLFWRSHRCARIIFSLKFHLGQMSAQQAVDFLVTRVGHERRNATAEVRRSIAGNYGPLYQAAYMLGGLQLRALHKDLVGSGKMTNRQFHDAVLRENAIPIEMIRASIAKTPLTRDYAASWRFYGDLNDTSARADVTTESRKVND